MFLFILCCILILLPLRLILELQVLHKHIRSTWLIEGIYFAWRFSLSTLRIAKHIAVKRKAELAKNRCNLTRLRTPFAHLQTVEVEVLLIELLSARSPLGAFRSLKLCCIARWPPFARFACAPTAPSLSRLLSPFIWFKEALKALESLSWRLGACVECFARYWRRISVQRKKNISRKLHLGSVREGTY